MSLMEVAHWRRAARSVGSWSPEQRDTVVYGAAAVFALATIRLTSISLYKQWGEIALGPYVVGTVASLFLVRRARKRAELEAEGIDSRTDPAPSAGSGAGSASSATSATSPSRLSSGRVFIFLFVLAGATFLPLALEIFLQAQSGGTTHVQPEVLVAERAGKEVAAGQDPYPTVTSGHMSAAERQALKGQPAYDQYDPYGPLMAVFGIPSSLEHAPPTLTDARVYFSLVTLLLVAIALALCRGASEPRVLALQGMTVLPMAALPMATGGDDLPVAAVLLLGMFLLHRRRALAGGLVLGFAAGLKFTAWPLVLLAFLIVRDREGRRTRGIAWMLAGMAVVLLPSVLPVFLHNPTSFVDNVVRYPLGLAKIGSPAASALPGHILVTAFPQIKHVFPFVLAAVGAVVIGWILLRHRPRNVSDVVRLGGWLMAAGILFAPATRVGYLLYPINFFIWSWLLRSEEDAEVSLEAATVVANASVEDRAPVAA